MILRKLNIVSFRPQCAALDRKKKKKGDCFCTDGVDQNSQRWVYIIYV